MTILEKQQQEKAKLIKVLSETGMKDIIDIDALQKMQDNIAEISGISIVAVDAKGTPITKETSFTSFCKLRRTIDECRSNCFFSDAYGGLKAAMKNTPYIYKCPAGLVDCAVPINIYGIYLGAILMGQVRCETKSIKGLENVKNFTLEDINEAKTSALYDEYKKTKIVKLERLKLVANMFHLIIDEMIEKKVEELYRKRIEQERDDLKSEVKKMAARQNISKTSIKYNNQSIDLRNRFLTNIMNSLGNLSIIEGAYKTNEMTCLFSKMLQYNFGTHANFVSLEKELDNVKNYLRIQQICSANKFDYELKYSCSLKNKFIPYFSIYIFAENSILHGFDKIDYKGKLKISIFEDEKDYFVQIEDNGSGMDPKKFKAFFKKDVDSINTNDYELSIQSFRKRIISLFGKGYDIKIQSKYEEGFRTLIKIPLAIEGIKVNG
ncbi:MAG: PocR ligand-binding domain-containing protein [Liquorilactobacillus nagelii]|uniref:Histidine kinase n=4 Tax=Liquorilactobacillus nagelii TaxID=82688 RepID=A0A3Q8CZU5_9LACO|nr:PocR ligand-binding domain-containing protein [Liquorilactobacillus nagelii]AUJ32721.1 hypothetical protein BSQ50_09350 [Liquorilactobacillus nagelii]MCP9315639.1 PocR ligand-binding domain-containing protein [Liquorilactobacillus nagelii]